MRRIAFVFALTALLGPIVPASALGPGPLHPVPPGGSYSSSSVPGATEILCEGQNQNRTSPLCEPLEFIDIVITAVGQPQFVYGPYAVHARDSRDVPLGYVSNPVYPVRTHTEPRTYWVRSLRNLSTETMRVTRCQARPEGTPGDPTCHAPTHTWNYWEHVVAPGEEIIFDDPASHKQKMLEDEPPGNYFLPLDPERIDDPYHWASTWNQDVWLTTSNRREMRGMLKHVYYDCSIPGYGDWCPQN